MQKGNVAPKSGDKSPTATNRWPFDILAWSWQYESRKDAAATRYSHHHSGQININILQLIAIPSRKRLLKHLESLPWWL